MPDTQGEAFVSVPIILGDFLLKIEAYGLIHLNLEILPGAHAYLAPILVILTMINIIYSCSTSSAKSNMKCS
ncbi:MAG: hypothetical protein ACQJCO_01685 [cyanobacterium endosymbiont of Rhopalodia sterrenbergii]